MIWFLIQEQGLFNWIEVDSHLSPRYLKPENFLPRQRHRRAWFNTDEEVDTSNMLSTNLSCFASSFFWPLPVSLLFDLLLVFINLIRVFHLLSVVYNRKGETFSIFENHSREKILQMLRFIWDLDESVLFFLRRYDFIRRSQKMIKVIIRKIELIERYTHRWVSSGNQASFDARPTSRVLHW